MIIVYYKIIFINMKKKYQEIFSFHTHLSIQINCIDQNNNFNKSGIPSESIKTTLGAL